jgi:hypothetical protein
MAVVAQQGIATAATARVTLSASSGSHSVRVAIQDPCAGDPFGVVGAVTGAGANVPGAIAVTTLRGDLLQAAAWSGTGNGPAVNRIGCHDGQRHPAGTYVLTVLARATVRISTALKGPATVHVSGRSRATLRATDLTGSQAATSTHEEQTFSTSPAAVAVFSESIYTGYVTSTPYVCIRRTSGACSDGIGLIVPGIDTVVWTSTAVQTFSGAGFATFEEVPGGVRTHRTDISVVLPR